MPASMQHDATDSCIWLSMAVLGVVVTMHIELSMAKSMHAGFGVHSPPLLAGHAIFLSLFGMAMRLALHAVANTHHGHCIHLYKKHTLDKCMPSDTVCSSGF
jgi:hypothetical protein